MTLTTAQDDSTEMNALLASHEIQDRQKCGAAAARLAQLAQGVVSPRVEGATAAKNAVAVLTGQMLVWMLALPPRPEDSYEDRLDLVQAHLDDYSAASHQFAIEELHAFTATGSVCAWSMNLLHEQHGSKGVLEAARAASAALRDYRAL